MFVEQTIHVAGRVAESVGQMTPAADPAVRASIAGPQSGRRLPAKEVHAHLRRCLAEMYRAEQNVFLWFSEIHERGLYRELGYSSIQAYATEELGFTVNRVNRYLHLISDLANLPRIRTALYAGEIGWTKARAIVKVSSRATEERWLAEAVWLSRRDLEAKVARARERAAAERRGNPAQPELAVRGSRSRGPRAPRVPDTDGCSLENTEPVVGGGSRPLAADGPVSLVFRLQPIELARYEALIETIRKRRCVMREASREQILLQALGALIAQESEESDGCTDGPEDGADTKSSSVPRGTDAICLHQIAIYKCATCQTAMVQTQRGPKRISPAQLAAAECDAVITKPRQRNRSTIPPTVRRQVLARAQHRCQAPGCNRTRFLEVHHIRPRERGGTNHPDNLIVLCSSCHRLWHEQNLDERLGWRPPVRASMPGR